MQTSEVRSRFISITKVIEHVKIRLSCPCERGCRYIFPINLEIRKFCTNIEVVYCEWYIKKIVLVITPYKNNVSLITIITSIYGFKFWESDLHTKLESEISVLQNCGYIPLVKF